MGRSRMRIRTNRSTMSTPSIEYMQMLDAATCATQLLKKESATAEWQAAMECLILVAEKNGPTMMARIGVMRALNRHIERVFDPSR
jgi:hypothetical protein